MLSVFATYTCIVSFVDMVDIPMEDTDVGALLSVHDTVLSIGVPLIAILVQILSLPPPTFSNVVTDCRLTGLVSNPV